jgi:hypothetical protein
MRWLFVVGGVAALAVGAWYFGQPKSTAVAVTTTPAKASAEEAVPAGEPTKDIAPLKIVEVIDLTRGFEPVPDEPATTPLGIQPASLIAFPALSDRMPIAAGDRWQPLTIAPREVKTERLDIQPREVPQGDIPALPILELKEMKYDILEGLPFLKK